MMTLFNNMLRDQRVSFYDPLLSEDPTAMHHRVQEPMKVIYYSARPELYA